MNPRQAQLSTEAQRLINELMAASRGATSPYPMAALKAKNRAEALKAELQKFILGLEQKP